MAEMLDDGKPSRVETFSSDILPLPAEESSALDMSNEAAPEQGRLLEDASHEVEVTAAEALEPEKSCAPQVADSEEGNTDQELSSQTAGQQRQSRVEALIEQQNILMMR